MKRPLIASPPWTLEEESRLRAAVEAGDHPAAIGKALQRTEQAVRHRMNKLGILSKRALSRAKSSPAERLKAARVAVSAGWIGLKAKAK